MKRAKQNFDEIETASQDKIVHKIFSGFKVASDTRRSNVKSVINRVRNTNKSLERSMSIEGVIPEVPVSHQKKKSVVKKMSRKKSVPVDEE